MEKTIHPIAIAVHLEDAFNRRDVRSALEFLHRTVEISQPDGRTAVGHAGARRLIEAADVMGTGRYVEWAHYVSSNGVVTGALKVELCEKTSGETLAQSEFLVTADCEAGKVRSIEVQAARRLEGDRVPELAH